MGESLLLPLRPSTLSSSSKDSLQVKIAQINHQKGDFRNVTEASLLEEINSKGTSDGDVEMDSDNDNHDYETEPEDRQALLWKGREEMLQQIDRARNETLTALDFISFLLSKHLTSAQTSMSPVLKEAVPTGSLDCRIVKYAPPSASEDTIIDQVRRGWKMQSFRSAAEKMSTAGSKLQDEAERESRYWDQVSSLKARGWAVSRLPRDSRTVGVHFGFAEAAPAFRNRGFAVLRRGQDGNLKLDRGVLPARPAAIKVTISRNGQAAGSSTVHKAQITDDSPIQEQILQAHNTLSEEELFHEISREARLLANQGVVMSAKCVKFDVGDELGVQIHLVNLDTERTHSDADAEAAGDATAEAIAASLRILLAHAHQRNLQRRSAPPPPMTLKPRPIPEYALLRPVMGLLQHESHLASLRSSLAALIAPLQKAGLTKAAAKTNALTHLNISLPENSNSSLSSKALLEPLIAPLESSLVIELPTKRALELKLKTYLGPPIFGTEFSVVTPLKYGTLTLIPPRLETVTHVEDFLRHVIMVDIVAFIAELSAVDADSASPDLPRMWKITDANLGEMSLQPQNHSAKKLQVRLWRDKLGLRFVTKSSSVVAYIWDAKKCSKTESAGGKEEGEESLEEVIRIQAEEGKVSGT